MPTCTMEKVLHSLFEDGAPIATKKKFRQG